MVLIRFVLLLIISFHSILFATKAIDELEIPLRPNIQYESPTKRFIAHHHYEAVLQALKTRGLSLEHRNFFEHIIPHEELGFFGYHSSTQGFRIYQDIIRIVLEEICEIEIKKDFHFLRIPGKPSLNCQSAQEFLNDYPMVNDQIPEQREQLLSLNYSLFGNFNNFGECTVYWFTTNNSCSTVGFQTQLNQLFVSLGIPTDTLPQLFAIGDPLRATDNAVLFQFFDFSHHNPFGKHYSLVDQMCYNATSGGAPSKLPKLMSEVYVGLGACPFPAQFRLLINNTHTLNPYSPLHIKRFDRNSPSLAQAYETNLHDAIKALPYDPIKVKEYRELLLNIWEQSYEN